MVEMEVQLAPESRHLQVRGEIEAPFSDIAAHERASFLSRYIPTQLVERRLDEEGAPGVLGRGSDAVRAIIKWASYRPREILGFGLPEGDEPLVRDDDGELRLHPNLLEFASRQPDIIKNLSRDAAASFLGLVIEFVGRNKPEDKN